MHRLIVLVLVLSACGARAQTITGPAGTYTATETLPTAGVVTLSTPWAGVPGLYTILVPGPVTVTSTPTSTTFTWGSVPPPPTPPPTPPTPVETAHLWVIAVFDTDALPSLQPGQIALHTSMTAKPALKALDADWLELSTKNPEATKYAALLPSLPGILILKRNIDGKGDIVGTPAALVDEPSLISSVSKLRGK
jgi:hypothetical protein